MWADVMGVGSLHLHHLPCILCSMKFVSNVVCNGSMDVQTPHALVTLCGTPHFLSFGRLPFGDTAHVGVLRFCKHTDTYISCTLYSFAVCGCLWLFVD